MSTKKIIIWSKHKNDNAYGYLCTYGNIFGYTIKKYIDDLINIPKNKDGFSSSYMYENMYLNGKLKKINNRKFENDKYHFTVSFD